ncbi:MAG: hypothetical protein ACLUZQ_06075 [Butyricicoccus sp.]
MDNTAQAVALDVENDRLNEARRHGTQHRPCSALPLLHSEIDQADRLFDVCLPRSKTA